MRGTPHPPEAVAIVRGGAWASQSPLADLADRAGVPHDTAKSWVNGQCRGPRIPRRKYARSAPRRLDDIRRVSNAPLREAFEWSGLSLAELSRRVYGNHRSTSTVRRTLGLAPDVTASERGRPYVTVRSAVCVDVAERYARAIGADPWEVGV